MQSTVCSEEQDIVAQLRRKIQELRDEIQELRDAREYQRNVSALPSTQISQPLKILLPILCDTLQDSIGKKKSVVASVLAKLSGLSEQTVGTALQEANDRGLLIKQVIGTRDKKTGRFKTRIWLTPLDALFTLEYTPRESRKHGGKKDPRCPSCGSKNVKTAQEVRLHTTITCKDCGAQEESSEPIKIKVNPIEERMKKTIEKARREKRQNDLDQNVPLKPDQECSDDPSPEVNLTYYLNPIGLGAEKGLEPSSITNSPKLGTTGKPATNKRIKRSSPGEEKAALAFCLPLMGGTSYIACSKNREGWRTVHRKPGATVLDNHFSGKQMAGFSFVQADGTTQMFVFDADNEKDWATLCEAALLLDAAGVKATLEASHPGSHHHGGHLHIVFDDPVNALYALSFLRNIAPMLRDIREFWPGGKNGHVRFPGALYTRNGIEAWGYLTDAHGVQLSDGGVSGAVALYRHQTPSRLVQEYSDRVGIAALFEDEPLAREEEPVRPREHSRKRSPREQSFTTVPDEHHIEKYGPDNPFNVEFNAKGLARAANDRIDLHKTFYSHEKWGNVSATWRGDRNPSLCIYEGNTWADFGGVNENGKVDGGDVVEFYCRYHGVDRPEALRILGRWFREEAESAIVKAAQAGKPIPAWISQYATITSRGERLYQDNLSK